MNMFLHFHSVDGISTISIVVPTYCRPQGIDQLMGSFISLNHQRHRIKEIVIVDDSPDKSTKVVVEKWGKMISFADVVYLHNDVKGGPGKARNIGARLCTSDYVAFTDDDCVAHENWADQMVEVFDREDPRTAAINGYKIPLHVTGPVTRYLKAGCLDKWKRSLDTANCAVRLSSYQKVDGFDENFTTIGSEDTILTIKFILNGFRIGYSSGAVIYHEWKEDLNDLRVHSRFYGKGERDLYERYFRDMKDPGKIENMKDAGWNVRNPIITSRNIIEGLGNITYATRSWFRNGVSIWDLPTNMFIWTIVSYERYLGWKESANLEANGKP
jgi:GT2 family glycosyltransferase